MTGYDSLLARRFYMALDTGKRDAVDAAHNEYRAYIDFLVNSGKGEDYNHESEAKIESIYESARAVSEE